MFHPGSTPKVIGEEVRYLREFGNNAEAMAIMEGIPSGGQYNDFLEGLPIRYLSSEFGPVFAKLNFKFPYFAFFSSYHLLGPYFAERVVKRREYDAIIAHGTYTFFTTKRLSEKKNIPYFAFIWDPISYILRKCYTDTALERLFPILLPLGSSLDAYLAKDPVAVITCSKFHVELIRSKTKRPIEIVYPGCEPVEKPLPTRGDYILAVDRWDVGNTPNKLLRMMAHLPSQARLLVAGFWYPHSLRESFEREVRELGLTERVRTMGPADRTELIHLYSGARVLVHPNEEVFGFVPHEAAACGCPIIMPGTSGNTDVYKDGVHGFFPRKFDAGEFASCVERLVLDERLAWKMGFQAWEAAKGYTWRNHTAKLNDVIRKYIN